MTDRNARDVNTIPFAKYCLHTSHVQILCSATIWPWAFQIFTLHYQAYGRHIFQAPLWVQHQVLHRSAITRDESKIKKLNRTWKRYRMSVGRWLHPHTDLCSRMNDWNKHINLSWNDVKLALILLGRRSVWHQTIFCSAIACKYKMTLNHSSTLQCRASDRANNPRHHGSTRYHNRWGVNTMARIGVVLTTDRQRNHATTDWLSAAKRAHTTWTVCWRNLPIKATAYILTHFFTLRALLC